MATTISKLALRFASRSLPDRMHDSLVRISARRLADQLFGKIADDFLELLLGGMELAFCASRDYRKNIDNFRGTYAFRTKDGKVAARQFSRTATCTSRTQPTHPTTPSFPSRMPKLSGASS